MLTMRDAQKIRFHDKHGMTADRGLHLPLVIAHGDYYKTKRGSDLQVEVVLHEPNNPKRAYFLVLARNADDTAVFMRTFYFTAEMTRSRMKGATIVLDQAKLGYFKM